jgi:two-component system, NarL family, response regulator DevR
LQVNVQDSALVQKEPETSDSAHPKPSQHVYQIAHVDDHTAMQLGFAAAIAAASDLQLVCSVRTVAEVLALDRDLDLVVLDLRLSDGSTVTENVEALRERGYGVLAFTGADDPELMRAASRAGVLGIMKKSDELDVLVDGVRRAAIGETIATTEWATALDSDPILASAALSKKETQVLALYASGESSHSVAYATGLSVNTVGEYVRRIRTKYAIAGRPAHTKVELYKRAVEDGFLPSPGA